MPELTYRNKTNHTGRIRQLLEEFYNEAVPGYVVAADKTFIKLRVAEWDGSFITLKITIDDVVEYYRTQAPNISSGLRTIAGHTGDWRNIEEIAKECLEWFKYVNIKGLRIASRSKGLEPRF